MIVETVAVGSELLLGQIVNGNAAELAVKLAASGLDHHHQTVVGDNLARLVAVLRDAVDRSDAVIVTGGIGPTQDDLTREALCIAAGVPMDFDEGYADELREMWRRRGGEMPERNLRQAERPEGAETLPNPQGTAPGVKMQIGDTWVFAVPGVPAEMRAMVDDHVLPFLREVAGEATVVSVVLRTWGESEAAVAERLADLFDAGTDPTVAFLAGSGEVAVRLTARAEDEAGARASIAPVEDEVRRRLGPAVFGVDDDTVESVLVDLLGERSWSMVTAESVTGGLVASRIVSVPGVSEWFRGSVVAYATGLKTSVLGVADEVVAGHGAVSEETAAAMADGVIARCGGDVAVAVTGWAGPSAPEGPAGTVVVAVRTPEGLRCRTLRLPGDRERVRDRAATAALHLTRLAVAGTWWPTGRVAAR